MELAALQKQIEGAVEKVSDSVVAITSRRLARGFPFGVFPVDGAGSGVTIDPEGYIVTNNHVIDEAAGVQLSLKDGRKPVGEVVGVDHKTDLALIKITGDKFPAADLGNSEELKVGQLVLAVGNALGLPGGPTASLGVISALGRPFPNADFIGEGMIQTDAHVNPGNSGGPLANIDGHVIGITTAVMPFAQGVGFAIPASTVKWIAGEIKTKGRVVRPWLGIAGVTINEAMAKQYDVPAESGALVIKVEPFGPAADAGIRPGDVLTKIDQHEVTAMKDLLSALAKLPIGSEVEVSYSRGGTSYQTSLRLVEAPGRFPLRPRRWAVGL